MEGRARHLRQDAAALAEAAKLDGCHVITTDLPKAAAAAAPVVHDRYLDLTGVERDFRTLKTGQLDLRPMFLRKEGLTRGHALVCLLALKLARELDRRLGPLGLTVEDGLERPNPDISYPAAGREGLISLTPCFGKLVGRGGVC